VDDTRWTGYALADAYTDDEKLKDGDFGYELPHYDPITLGKQDANIPIMNPREYFLLVVHIHMARVLNHWKDVVRQLKRNIKQHVRALLFGLALANIHHPPSRLADNLTRTTDSSPLSPGPPERQQAKPKV
jgi:hypothetical protein